jgi:hypothetical protein
VISPGVGQTQHEPGGGQRIRRPPGGEEILPNCFVMETDQHTVTGVNIVKNQFFTGKFVPAAKGLQVTERYGYFYGG